MGTGGSSLWKTIVLPPAFALLLYLAASYVLFPLYVYYRRQHPSSTSSLFAQLTKLFPAHLPTFMRGQRRGSTESGDSLLGDEELEEGIVDGSGGRRERPFGSNDRGGVERLSLELERGFKDDSDESSGDEHHRGRRP
ncbi:MAG: hypothetical protein L6R36_002555 [Xanthoria steineri]|nr:MAG: hypothetical protein L6R36_002555 [Xanthoria steineri]